ncbi:MAG TPA: riboflavin synthase [Planctomycetaceae bacterium]|nr:riboflavin synthase [Planctomycetaceae bacterium]HQZ63537.1 riboflavin synthase [Planctomycetaceae bacterium]
MFTGLVEGQGTVRQIASLPVGMRLTIAPDPACFPVSDVAIGDSISVCGCCLTVIAINDGAFDFEAGDETLSKTNLGRLKTGSRVNLERSLAANARLGGHFVQGHVDGVAEVCDIVQNGDWTDLWFRPAPEQHRLLVSKGSVAVDGISLTVVNVTADTFSVALIPHTLQVTTLGPVAIGDIVNIENDILGKYVDQLLERRIADGLISVSPRTATATSSRLNSESPPQP